MVIKLYLLLSKLNLPERIGIALVQSFFDFKNARLLVFQVIYHCLLGLTLLYKGVTLCLELVKFLFGNSKSCGKSQRKGESQGKEGTQALSFSEKKHLLYPKLR